MSNQTAAKLVVSNETSGGDRTQRLLEAFPIIDAGIIPLGSRVLVQIRKAKTKTAGGIILTDDTAETDKWNTQVAKVISVGALAFRNRETMEVWKEGEWCKPGDYVRCPKYHGDRWDIPLPKPADPRASREYVTFVMFRDLDITGLISGDPLEFRAFVD